MNNGSLLENRVLTLDQAAPGTGPLGPTIDIKLSPRNDTYLNIRTKVDNNFTPTINAQDTSSQQYVNNKYVNFTGREQIMPTVVQQINLKGHDEFHNLSINEARTTTKETTLSSYAGDAQQERTGHNFYRYADLPKITTKETTHASYAGDVNGNVTSHYQQNRVQFEGTTETFIDENGNVCKVKSASSGVTNWGNKHDTLYEHVPNANGSTNIQLDAQEKLGHTELKLDNESLNTHGVGSFEEARVNATRFQNVDKAIIGTQQYNPNKSQSVDNRQVAPYTILNLLRNDLSIDINPKFNVNNSGVSTVSFFQDSNVEYQEKFGNTSNNTNNNNLPIINVISNANNYSGTVTKNEPRDTKDNPQFNKIELQNGMFPINTENDNNKKIYNPNTALTNNTFNQWCTDNSNSFLYQQKKFSNELNYLNGGYPGNAIDDPRDAISNSVITTHYMQSPIVN